MKVRFHEILCWWSLSTFCLSQIQRQTWANLLVGWRAPIIRTRQVMTQCGGPRKRGQEDLHLQSCGALSSSPSPSMRHPKHLPQTTSASTNPLDSPSSERSLECRETILWPRWSKLWEHYRWRCCRRAVLRAVNVCRLTNRPSDSAGWALTCSTGKLKCSSILSSSALWHRAKSSAEMVANSEWACHCLQWLLSHQKNKECFSLRGYFLLSFISSDK